MCRWFIHGVHVCRYVFGFEYVGQLGKFVNEWCGFIIECVYTLWPCIAECIS